MKKCNTKKTNEINIGGRIVGENHPPLVVAELGINHNGSLDTAFKMVDAAARAGVEVLKHQTHIVEDEMSSAARKVIPGNSTTSIYDIMATCSLNEDEEFELKRYVESKGMIFISTPFSRKAAIRLEKMGVCAYKIGSGECNNYPLIKHIATYRKPIILSTGMNNLESIAKAVAILEQASIGYALLHTTNLYPTPPHLVRLGAMTQLKEAFPDAVIGLSDHTTNNVACLGAVALGASILERHFTDTMDRQGPDIVCSMDENHCRELIKNSKQLHSCLGGIKEATNEEKVTIEFAFATVVAIQPIAKGEKFSSENIWVKRPGTGEILAEEYENLLGKISARNISPDTHIRQTDIFDQ